jgi:hypothetical protein
MAQNSLSDVIEHWNTLIENFRTSPKEFYDSVEAALEQRKIPGLKVSRVNWSEGGVLSPNREYLRVEGGRHTFDMCAAPFGTGFFFSSWMTKRSARNVEIYFIAYLAVSLIIWKFLQGAVHAYWQAGGGTFGFLIQWGLASPVVLIPLCMLFVLWLIALLARAGNVEPELAIMAVPILGWIYKQLFAPETYYRLDTLMMFRSAVRASLMEAIDGQTTQKGVRALTEDERKPVFSKLI